MNARHVVLTADCAQPDHLGPTPSQRSTKFTKKDTYLEKSWLFFIFEYDFIFHFPLPFNPTIENVKESAYDNTAWAQNITTVMDSSDYK